MCHLAAVLRAASATVLTGGCACLGTATASADPTDTLAASLSKGYSSSNCKPVQIDGTVAAIECGQNFDPNGPVWARYLLFSNSTDLASSFTTSIGSLQQGNCGGAKSPTTWQVGFNPSGGQEACGTYHGQAEIIWTTDAKNVLSVLRSSGGDVSSLHSWWSGSP